MKENSIQSTWVAFLNGMIIFFTEGYHTWTQDSFYKAMHGEKFATDTFIRKKLIELEETGAIVYTGEVDSYIKIIDYDKLVAFEAKERALQ